MDSLQKLAAYLRCCPAGVGNVPLVWRCCTLASWQARTAAADVNDSLQQKNTMYSNLKVNPTLCRQASYSLHCTVLTVTASACCGTCVQTSTLVQEAATCTPRVQQHD